MKTFTFFFVIVITLPNLSAQEIIKVGDKAPKLNITDWVQNVPIDTSLEGKFLVLDFWATWCGPCIKAVPHLNELQAQFNNNKKVIFISMSDEKPEKIAQTLKRVKFNSSVVSDQNKTTHKNLDVHDIPVTFLIDDNGFIRWMGSPEELDDLKLKAFLSGKPVESKAPITEIVAIDTLKGKEKPQTKESSLTKALALLKDKNNLYTFQVVTSAKNDDKFSMNVLAQGKYIHFGVTLQTTFASLLNVSENKVMIPSSLQDKLVNIIYVNPSTKLKETAIADLKENLLKSFNLKMRSEAKLVDVYTVRVKDAKKLDFADAEMSSDSDAGDSQVYSNQSMGHVLNSLEKFTKLILIDETGLSGRYDFILNKSNVEHLQKNLESYGLTLSAGKKEIVFYILE